MIGYVLWSDESVGKAIIWCEDQGDLAFYLSDGGSSMVVSKGDWIQFDLSQEGKLRLAANARVLERHVYPELSEMLIEGLPLNRSEVEIGGRPDEGHVGGPPQRRSNVIPFPSQTRRRKTVRYG